MNAPIPPEVSAIAARAFADRQAKARLMVQGRKIGAGEASERLRPWLAIACLAWAELPELDEQLAELKVRDVDGTWRFSESEARALIADRLCPRARWVPLLAQARDAALRNAEAVCTSKRSQPHEREAALAPARALRDLARALAWDPAGRHPIPPCAEPLTTPAKAA